MSSEDQIGKALQTRVRLGRNRDGSRLLPAKVRVVFRAEPPVFKCTNAKLVGFKRYLHLVHVLTVPHCASD
jgi:hypothetical protein